MVKESLTSVSAKKIEADGLFSQDSIFQMMAELIGVKVDSLRQIRKRIRAKILIGWKRRNRDLENKILGGVLRSPPHYLMLKHIRSWLGN